jgi:hypothetical protein
MAKLIAVLVLAAACSTSSDVDRDLSPAYAGINRVELTSYYDLKDTTGPVRAILVGERLTELLEWHREVIKRELGKPASRTELPRIDLVTSLNRLSPPAARVLVITFHVRAQDIVDPKTFRPITVVSCILRITRVDNGKLVAIPTELTAPVVFADPDTDLMFQEKVEQIFAHLVAAPVRRLRQAVS